MLQRLNPQNWTLDWIAIAESALIIGLAVAAAYLLYRGIFAIASRLARASETALDDLVVQKIRRPVKWAMIAIAITLVAGANENLAAVWEPIARFVRPALLGWIAYTLVKAFALGLEYRLQTSEEGGVADIATLRSRKTRISILSRTATFVIVFITVGLMLLSIPQVAAIGTTVLASAGIAALAVGAAAQPALKSLIAGLQMALTEPLRIGDLVVIDGFSGRVEEIRMSYIIVRMWDERAVIVPTSRFLDNSFENWSRKNEKLTGPVMLHLDPIAEISPIRAEFERFVDAHPLWDRRTADLLMTDAYPESIALRLSVSSATIGDLFQLRCDLREHMLAWLREHQPDALIRHRLELPGGHAKAPEAEAP
ncbi:mechanosensitive ion channel family protein [Erythrobacter sp. SDW2]|uniref:mechanosensitive ion channel family protein n=1 Tax=Erythrobacter sp. SDW2 TaxID=2907154 RepID=UPI001F273A5B|nr:mechanosensitive ion channel domain-containing protein [Erythrobacter sp. SDW2]UIP07075.1 mechanosensitive ion channel family protein [Erythrobacter sp. SDW2]